MKLTLTRYMTCVGWSGLEINDVLCESINRELAKYHTKDGKQLKVDVSRVEALYTDLRDSEENREFFDTEMFYKDQLYSYLMEDVIRDTIANYLYEADYDIVNSDTQDCYIEVEG